MSRLGRDIGGNVMAISAAMILPIIGLVGGAVDMSRLYATKTRLQAACDAGALAGRRTMGTGTWAASSNRANTQAQKVFTLNFKPGAFGSTGESVSYTEDSGNVTGDATAQVPMTLMRVFGTPTSTVTATCSSMMVIPNTDVMFVLDTTGSMAGTRIAGLKDAVKCFYEALARENTDAVCETAAGQSPPSGGLSNAVQLRFGFMPYATNVNVGKLLKPQWFADNRDYQSRIVNTTQVWAYTVGDESVVGGWGSWTGALTADNLGDQSKYSGWTYMDITVAAGGPTVTINGVVKNKRPSTTTYNTSAKCLALNVTGTIANQKILDYTDSAASPTAAAYQSTSPAVPDHSANPVSTEQTLTYKQDTVHTYVGYKYAWYTTSNPDSCRLQVSSSRTNTETRNGTSTKPITWTPYNKFVDYTYKKTSLNISGLKNGTTWNDSAAIPNLGTTTTTVRLSGQTTDSTISIPGDYTVNWNGCIEEAYEPRNVAWASGIPTDAYGANIDLIPNSTDPNTLWAPALGDAVWGRQSGGSFTRADVTASSMGRNYSNDCPNQAAKLKEWAVGDYEDYVDGLTTGGQTYHDVGLVWGGRFLSPDGIFASENKETEGQAQIYRHMIFMTDGDTNATPNDYTSQGVAWWDRRQTDESTAPTDIGLEAVVNARFSAICTAIKEKGIVLWVVSYGGSTSTTTNDRLRQCSSDPTIRNTTTRESNRFFLSSNRTTLINTFKGIANQISSLRLTS